jgi:hypothetical protein
MADPHTRSSPRSPTARVRAPTSCSPPSCRRPPAHLQLPRRPESSISPSRTSPSRRMGSGSAPPRTASGRTGHATPLLVARTCRRIRTRRAPSRPQRTDQYLSLRVTRIILRTRRYAAANPWPEHRKRTSTYRRVSARWISHRRTRAYYCARPSPTQFAVTVRASRSNGYRTVTRSHTIVVACPAQLETCV